MKIYKNIRNNKPDPIFAMANIPPRKLGENFELWIDDSGSSRTNSHNEARFKPEANGIELDYRISRDGTITLVNNNPRLIQKFKYSKEVEKFLTKFMKPLFMHWDREIDTHELVEIIRQVNKFGKTIEDAIEIVVNDDY